MGTGEALKDADSSEYAPIYEDKDGDWMLVGDVPWGYVIIYISSELIFFISIYLEHIH